MPKRRIRFVEFPLPEPRLNALRAATRQLRRRLGSEAPSLEELIAFHLSGRDARLIANEWLASDRGRAA